MKTVRLGARGPDIFPLVLGGNTFGWTSDLADSFAVLDAFAEAGGTLVDTADAYSSWVEGHEGGESEHIIGRWLAARPGERLLVGTKVSRHPQFPGLSRANVLAAADASLGRLGVETLDVYSAHYDDPNVELEETVGVFHELQVAGKVRYVGVSNYSAERLIAWIGIADRNGWERPVALQPHYNLVHRSVYEPALAAVAETDGLGVTPYFALASGFLSGKYRSRTDLADSPRERFAGGYFSEESMALLEALAAVAADRGVEMPTVALAWLRTRPGITAPIASARVVSQLPALLASADLELTPEEIAVLEGAPLDATSGTDAS